MPETRNRHQGFTHSSVVADGGDGNGVDTDGSGQATVDFSGLREIESVEAVSVSAGDGYVANCVSVDGNTATVEVYESAGSAAAMSLNTGGSDVTTLYASAYGL